MSPVHVRVVGLVGHSYGAVVALLMAGAALESVHSLALLEPPVRQLARGVPEVEEAIFRHEELVASGDPEQVYRGMLRALGAPMPDRRLTDVEHRHTVLLMNERRPWDAALPLEQLRTSGVPTLVVTGGHDPVFELLGERLARELDGRRMVLTGAGHPVQRAPGVNDALERFWAGVV